MLVSENIVKRWFRTDSPVYKNFAYLFQNPLWTKPIPRGFTVCPFFWMAMFSALIFQPLVFLIVNFFAPVVKFGGRPFVALDRLLQRLAAKVGFKDTIFANATGGGLFFGVFVVVLCVFLWAASSLAHLMFVEINKNAPRGKWFLLNMLAFPVLMLAAKTTDKNPKPAILGLLGFTAVFSTFLFHSEVFTILLFIFSGIGMALKGILYGLLYAPFGFYIPWFVYILGPIALFGLIPMTEKQLDYNYVPENHDYSLEWLHVFRSVVQTNKGFGDSLAFYLEVFQEANRTEAMDYALSKMGKRLLVESTDNFLQELAQELKNLPCFGLSRFDWKRVKGESGLTDKWQSLANRMQGLSEDSRDNLYRRLQTKVGNQEVLGRAAKLLKTKYDKEYSYYLSKFDPDGHQMKPSAISLLLAYLGNRFVYKPFVWFGKKVENGFMFIITFMAYIWTLIKSAKKGACPYFQFEDTPKPEGGKKW